MPLHEYNFTNKEIRNKKIFQLVHENIIVNYDVVGDLEDFDNRASHGNSKGTQIFCPTMHSVKQKCKEILFSTIKPPRFIMNDLKKNKMHLVVKLMLLFPEMLVIFITLKLIDRMKPKTTFYV